MAELPSIYSESHIRAYHPDRLHEPIVIDNAYMLGKEICNENGEYNLEEFCKKYKVIVSENFVQECMDGRLESKKEPAEILFELVMKVSAYSLLHMDFHLGAKKRIAT